MMLSLFLAQGLALTGATVHTMAPGEEPAPATILIEDGRIEAVGADLEVPDGYETLDLAGLHLIPGLIDGAVNHDSDHDILYTAAGITLVRDTGNDLSRILAERAPAARDRVPGPDLFLPGLPFDGQPPATTMSVVVTDPERGKQSFDRLLRTVAPDYITISEGLPPAIWRELLGWSDAMGLDVWGPMPRGVDLDQVLEARQGGLMSLQALLPPGVLWHELDDLEPLERNIAKLAAGETGITPMLMVYGRMLRDWSGDVEELAYLGPHYRQNWAMELRGWRDRMSPEVRGWTEKTLELERQTLAKLAAAGVELVPGSGAPNSGLLPGRSLLDELDQWASAGIEPYEVLRMATSGAARALRVDDQHGTLAEGAVANVVALGLDPRDGLEALREPELVVLRGHVLERDYLQERLRELRERQKQRFLEINMPVDVPAPDLPDGTLVLRGKAELRSEGVRINSEHFAVVDTPEGDRVYATRILNQETATTAGTELHLSQTFREDRMQAFDMSVKADEQVYSITGRLLGGLMNVQVKGNGLHLYGSRAQQVISLVDVGGALTAVLAGQKLTTERDNYVLGFEDLDPIVHRWRLHIAPDDHQFVIDGGIGYLWYAFRGDGAPIFAVRQQGTGQTEIRFLEVTSPDGSGLPLEEGRIWVETAPDPEQGGGR